jgi:vitamin B12 transporter
MPLTPIDTDQIVITASRAPETEAQSPASVTVIDEQRIERLGEPLVPALLRLVPSIAVTQSGSAGTLAEVRIRGAEANHTLLFIDGIRANDPARGEAPRFELLNADIAARLEVVRGPQSALWGSEAIGGVVAINGEDEAAAPYAAVSAEAGSLDFRRGSLSAGMNGIAGAIGWQSASGIDIQDSGDHDGYSNLAARVRVSHQFAPEIQVGAAGFLLSGRSEYDDAFLAPVEPSQRDRMIAGRGWAEAGQSEGAWHGTLSFARLHSTSRNLYDGKEGNRTSGSRTTLSGQAEHRLVTGVVNHLVILAGEHERETFSASDTIFGGITEQARDRNHDAFTLEWRASGGPLHGDVAVRHDVFNHFKDATTIRASMLGDVGAGFSLAASYGEGIAQPTFFDLYGFSPQSFIGNPDLKPESSRGWETSVRYRSTRIEGALTYYRQRLRDEIVDVFDVPSGKFTTANADRDSRRSGLEAEFGYIRSDKLRFTASYAYLRASEPTGTGGRQIREVRRPKHSGSVAFDGTSGKLTYGASLAYSGARFDNNFNVFPSEVVRLHAYWLADARVAYALSHRIQLFARGSNLFDDHYQDVFGYRTEGRGIYAGIRLAAGR